jgi:TonB-dependent receptor
VRQVTGASSSGNPYLDPWRSNNYDLAIEYYLGRASLFNVGLFKLDINSFVTTGTDKGSFPDQDGVIRREVPVTRPIQGKGGSLQGLEAGAKLAFSDVIPDAGFLRNFGIDANYTFSDSSQERRDLEGEKLPFQDNSKHQVNFALWYQDEHFQARVAYNYRTPRLSSTFQPATTFCTGTNDPAYCVPADQPAPVIPVFQDTSQYVDVNVTYNLNDHFSVYANASKVLGEIERYYFQFDGDSKQFHSRNEFEPRYSAGIRFKF